MPKRIVPVDGLPETMGPYSQCVAGEGRQVIFISGQVPEDSQGNLVGAGDIAAQTRQVLANIKLAVEAAGGKIGDICKITILVVGLEAQAYETVARERRTFFGGDYPASTLMEVPRLASPDWLIEIEAYAVI
jgi:enamine deaminase RidA (YjgF/YER057c/UK114 family)